MVKVPARFTMWSGSVFVRGCLPAFGAGFCTEPTASLGPAKSVTDPSYGSIAGGIAQAFELASPSVLKGPKDVGRELLAPGIGFPTAMMALGVPALGEREALGEFSDVDLRHAERNHQPANRILRIDRNVSEIDSIGGVSGLLDHDHLLDDPGQIVGVFEQPPISVIVIQGLQRCTISRNLPPGTVFVTQEGVGRPVGLEHRCQNAARIPGDVDESAGLEMFQRHVVPRIYHHHNAASPLEDRSASLVRQDSTCWNSLSLTGGANPAPGPDGGALVMRDHAPGRAAGTNELSSVPSERSNTVEVGLDDLQNTPSNQLSKTPPR